MEEKKKIDPFAFRANPVPSLGIPPWQLLVWELRRIEGRLPLRLVKK